MIPVMLPNLKLSFCCRCFCFQTRVSTAWLQIVHMEDLPARQPQYALPSHPLSEPVQAALAARGINQMFTHQAQAVDAVMAGKNVVVSTSTASGKSLCYNIPILEALVQDRRACALYMFPTKVNLPQALAHGICPKQADLCCLVGSYQGGRQ